MITNRRDSIPGRKDFRSGVVIKTTSTAETMYFETCVALATKWLQHGKKSTLSQTLFCSTVQ